MRRCLKQRASNVVRTSACHLNLLDHENYCLISVTLELHHTEACDVLLPPQRCKSNSQNFGWDLWQQKEESLQTVTSWFSCRNIFHFLLSLEDIRSNDLFSFRVMNFYMAIFAYKKDFRIHQCTLLLNFQTPPSLKVSNLNFIKMK